MDWHIIRHPETGGVAVIHEVALAIHKGLGWLRVGSVSEMDKDQVDKSQYEKAPDLDAAQAEKPTSSKSKES